MTTRLGALLLLMASPACTPQQMEALRTGLPSPAVAPARENIGTQETSAKSAGVAIGQVIRGSLSTAGEVDEFTFEGRKGQEVVLYFQKLAAEGPSFDLDLYNTTGRIQLAELGSTGSKPLEENYTETVTLREGGAFVIRVQGAKDSNRAAEARGGYQFKVMQVNRAPETQPRMFAVEQTVAGESIDVPGDIDEFAFPGRKGQEIVLYFQKLSEPSPSFDLDLYNTTGQSHVVGLGSTGSRPLEENYTETITLREDGEYIVIVRGAKDAARSNRARGPYRFAIRTINRAPESRSAAIPLAELIEGEALDAPGDIDEFTFEGRKGQAVVLHFQKLADGAPSFDLDLLGVTGQRHLVDLGSTGSKPLADNHSERVVLPEDGRYLVRVQGAKDVAHSNRARGAYRFTVKPAS